MLGVPSTGSCNWPVIDHAVVVTGFTLDCGRASVCFHSRRSSYDRLVRPPRTGLISAVEDEGFTVAIEAGRQETREQTVADSTSTGSC